MHNFLYSLTICLLHYYPRHVSSINMPIFRSKNCIHTASGIFVVCKRLPSTLVESGPGPGPGWKCVLSWSCSKAVYKLVWHIPVPSVQWINSRWWAEELPETCRVSCQNKFGKLVHIFGFIIKKVTFLFWAVRLALIGILLLSFRLNVSSHIGA